MPKVLKNNNLVTVFIFGFIITLLLSCGAGISSKIQPTHSDEKKEKLVFAQKKQEISSNLEFALKDLEVNVFEWSRSNLELRNFCTSKDFKLFFSYAHIIKLKGNKIIGLSNIESALSELKLLNQVVVSFRANAQNIYKLIKNNEINEEIQNELTQKMERVAFEIENVEDSTNDSVLIREMNNLLKKSEDISDIEERIGTLYKINKEFLSDVYKARESFMNRDSQVVSAIQNAIISFDKLNTSYKELKSLNIFNEKNKSRVRIFYLLEKILNKAKISVENLSHDIKKANYIIEKNKQAKIA